MEFWINFWNIFFWIIFFFCFFNSINFIQILLFSEIIWSILYILTILLGIAIDNNFLLTFSFLILGFAGLEFSIGLLIIIFFKKVNNSTFLLNKKNQKTLFLKIK